MKTLSITPDVLRKVDDFLAVGKNINAIKLVRAEIGCGLRDAKYAIDHRSGRCTAEEAGVVIGPMFRIKSIQLECDEGVVEVDMEELKLKFLMTLPELGIKGCGELLKLVQFIEEWQGVSKNGARPANGSEG